MSKNHINLEKRLYKLNKRGPKGLLNNEVLTKKGTHSDI